MRCVAARASLIFFVTYLYRVAATSTNNARIVIAYWHDLKWLFFFIGVVLCLAWSKYEHIQVKSSAIYFSTFQTWFHLSNARLTDIFYSIYFPPSSFTQNKHTQHSLIELFELIKPLFHNYAMRLCKREIGDLYIYVCVQWCCINSRLRTVNLAIMPSMLRQAVSC